jgi:RNA polymerase sigma factor (sigma-70 family)
MQTAAAPEPSQPERAIATLDEETWRDLYRNYNGLLRSVAFQHRLSAHEAEDAVQITWLQLVKYAGSLRDPECVAGWLHTTMRRTCLQIIGRRRREQLTADPAQWQVADDARQPDTEVVRAERDEALWRAVERLPGRQRELVRTLFIATELSYADVSVRLSMPVGAIGPTRSRALRRLRDCLAAAGLEYDDLLGSPGGGPTHLRALGRVRGTAVPDRTAAAVA